jgi:spermidine/putrescine transport system permease protein
MMSSRGRSRMLWNWAGLGPACVILLTFIVGPILIVLTYSFLEPNPYGGVRLVPTPEAYIQFLFDRDLDDSLIFNDAYLAILARSVILALAATIGALLVGFPVALYIATRPARQRSLLVLLVTVPFWTNLLIRTYCWILVLRDTGLISNALMAAGLIDRPLTLLYTDGAILLGLVYAYVPFMILPIYSTIEKLDMRLVEAAHDLYSSIYAAMRHVVVPLAMPGIVAGCILVFIPSLGAFIAPDLLGGGKKLMLGSLIQLQFSASRNWPFGSAVAIILLTVVMLALIFYALGPTRRVRTQEVRA